MKKYYLVSLAAILVVFFFLPFPHHNVQAGASDAYDLITKVNGLRTANGLPALEIDPILMSTAQYTAEYMASTKVCAHMGGVRERVIAAGYGGGANAFATENISCGPKTTDQAVYQDWADDLHMIPMTDGNYKHIGAGVVDVDGYMYFVVHAAYPSGGSYTPSSGSVVNTTTSGGSVISTVGIVKAVITATPAEDGSVMHEVQAGQSAWSIAIAYGIKIADIANLNGLPTANPVLQLGQKLLIKPSYTPTMTGQATATSDVPTETPQPSSTPRPTQPPPTPTITPTPTRQPLLPTIHLSNESSVGLVIVLICGAGLAAIMFTTLRGNKNQI
jgi:LysM repeat protein